LRPGTRLKGLGWEMGGLKPGYRLKKKITFMAELQRRDPDAF